MPWQITLKLENTAENRANLCCGQEKGGSECAGRQAHAIIVEQVGPAGSVHTDPAAVVHMVVTNVSNYFPVYPHQLKEGDTLEHDSEGWLGNGLKHHSSEHSSTAGLVQLNQCNDKIVTAQVCFVDGDYKPVHMKKARLRIFDIDMGKNPKRKGPETVQFSCPGGTFVLYGGTHPYVSWNAGKPIEVEKDAGYHGLTKYTYRCPEQELVTVWASMDGAAGKDAESAVPSELTLEQLKRTLTIEFRDTECANLTFANMPSSYRQVEGGWDLHLNAANGGNPLNGTRRLTYEAFDGLEDGPCPWDGSGRNNFISGYYDKHDMLTCDPPPSASPSAAPPIAPPAAPPAAPPTSPRPLPDTCKGPRKNVLKPNAKGVGTWGGSCTCPDGSEYEVGDLVTTSSCSGDQHLGLLACYGGKPGKINRFDGPWSGNKVDCNVCEECNGPYQNVFSEANDWDSDVGAWGGDCTCPDGQVYQVGDLMDEGKGATLACDGGEAGKVNQKAGPWSGNSVICSACPGPQPSESPCEVETRNVVTNNDTKVGSFGGDCTCPNGQVYQVGDVFLGGQPTLACFGGTPGTYNERHGLWSHVKVQCGACDACGGPNANVYNQHDPSAGSWGGQCVCPDGSVYDVGDRYDEAQSLKCIGGIWNVKDIHTYEGPWSRKSVVCSPCPIGDNTSHHPGLDASQKVGALPSKC